MTALLPNVDPDGLLEFSVVYTDRALNHMSKRFQNVMREMHRILTQVYHAEGAVIVPAAAPSARRPWPGSSPRARRPW